ncbi:MAG: hypothetical protein J7M40_06515 [Planctomycetes bacterium]|nr:hypothetical protein [Planctomycetota bacterium]
METRKLFLIVLGLAIMLVGSVGAAAISVNLAEGSMSAARDNQTVLPGELAGMQGYQAYNWNNVQTDASGMSLVDNAGAATGSVITFTMSNGWGDNTGDMSPDGKIGRGYFDDGDGAVSGDGIGVDIEVSNVPYSSYSVILLLSADSTDGNWGTFTVNGVGQAGPSKVRWGTVGAFEEGVNALLFTGQSGSTLDIHCPVRSGGDRGTIGGFQIVDDKVARLLAPWHNATDVPVDETAEWIAPTIYSPLGFNIYMDPNLMALDTALIAGDYTGTTLGLALDYDTSYLWRVDSIEPNEPGSPIVNTGDVWVFTTEKHPSQVDELLNYFPGISVLNPSFESVSDAGNDWGYEADDWFESWYIAPGGDPLENDHDPFWEIGTAIGMPNCDGDRWAGLDEAAAYYQPIGVVEAGQVLSLRMLVGVRSGWGTPEGNRMTVSLYSGGSAIQAGDGIDLAGFATLIDSFAFAPADLTPINANEFQLDVDMSSAAGTLGDTLWIHVEATLGRTYFDNVQFINARGTNAAWGPNVGPVNGEGLVSTTLGTLSWNTGVDVDNDYLPDSAIVGHHVYLSTDLDAVISFDTSASRGSQAVGDTDYDPLADGDPLVSNSHYYWIIVEELSGGASVPGMLWSFDTEELLPEITKDPVGAYAGVGGAAEFTVEATSATAEDYQWFKVVDGADDDAVPGGTDATLILSGIVADDAGWYYCRVHNDDGDTYSLNAFLVVKTLMGHWTFDEADALVSTVNPDHVGVVNTSNYVTDAIAGEAWQFLGEPNMIVVANSVDDFNFYAQGYSISAWIKTTQDDRWGAYVAKQATGPNRGIILTHSTAGNAVTTVRESFNDLASQNAVNDGEWHHIVGTYNAATGMGEIYVDGKFSNDKGPNLNPLTLHDQPLFFGAETVDGNVSYVGLLDDVQITNYPLDGVEVATIYTTIRTDETICVLPYDVMDFDQDCKVGVSDMAAFALSWLDCNLIPVERCNE